MSDPDVHAEDEKDGDGGLHVIVSDTGRELHVFRNAKGMWNDHTGKEWTTYVVTSDGEEVRIYCGRVCYCVPESESDAPSADELLEKHTNDFTGEHDWGYVA